MCCYSNRNLLDHQCKVHILRINWWCKAWDGNGLTAWCKVVQTIEAATDTVGEGDRFWDILITFLSLSPLSHLSVSVAGRVSVQVSTHVTKLRTRKQDEVFRAPFVSQSKLRDLRETRERSDLTLATQGPSTIIFVQKMAQRCGVWRMTSQDQDQVSMKSNVFGFGGYSQMKFWKCYKLDKKVSFGYGLVW